MSGQFLTELSKIFSLKTCKAEELSLEFSGIWKNIMNI